jgi:hypothetical protein
MLEMWRSVLKAAGRETDFQVPESGAQRAKAFYRIARPERADSLPLRFARLVFSSSAEPLREGVRSGEASTSHLLFEEGNYVIDLHIKAETERNLVSVAGQFLDRAKPDRVYENNVVTILRQDEELARTATNEFGEFHLEFVPGGELMLAVKLEGQSVLVSGLPEPAAGRRPADQRGAEPHKGG